MTDDSFASLRKIKPDAAPKRAEPTDRDIDAVVQKNGNFPSRAIPVERIIRTREVEPTTNLNMRPKVRVYNRFVQWAMDNKLSYPDALEELMNKAKV